MLIFAFCLAFSLLVGVGLFFLFRKLIPRTQESQGSMRWILPGALALLVASLLAQYLLSIPWDIHLHDTYYSVQNAPETQEAVLHSPSGLYVVEIDENAKGILTLRLLDSSNRDLGFLDTHSSVYQKWAVGWYRGNDTIIVNSRDIGTYAYAVSKAHGFTSLPANEEINREAEMLFAQKHAERCSE
jgi:hypothetical protein